MPVRRSAFRCDARRLGGGSRCLGLEQMLFQTASQLQMQPLSEKVVGQHVEQGQRCLVIPALQGTGQVEEAGIFHKWPGSGLDVDAIYDPK